MTQAPPTPSSLPPPPPGTPKALVNIFSVLLVVAGPFLAFWDPSGKLNSGMAQALVILVFVAVGAAIFIVREAIDGYHRYGFSMQTLNFILHNSTTQIDQDWLDFKNAWPQVAPLLKQLPGVSATVSDMQQSVAVLTDRITAATAATGMTPEQVVHAVETVTGMTLPRLGAATVGLTTPPAPVDTPPPAADPPPPAPPTA